MQFILSSGNNEQSINEITLRMTMKEHYWAIMILSAFIGPILEELIFRWFIFSSINKSLIIKVIVSSVLFGLMHFIPSIGAISLNELCLQSIQYVLAGIAFCLVYIKRGNVVFGIAAHMSINLMHNLMSVSYTHLRAHETGRNLVCRLLLEKKKKKLTTIHISKPTILWLQYHFIHRQHTPPLHNQPR